MMHACRDGIAAAVVGKRGDTGERDVQLSKGGGLCKEVDLFGVVMRCCMSNWLRLTDRSLIFSVVLRILHTQSILFVYSLCTHITHMHTIGTRTSIFFRQLVLFSENLNRNNK
jgi:hypothetical protein